MTVRVRACYMIHFRFHQDEDIVTVCVRVCLLEVLNQLDLPCELGQGQL